MWKHLVRSDFDGCGNILCHGCLGKVTKAATTAERHGLEPNTVISVDFW
jgi:hypothetical protein